MLRIRILVVDDAREHAEMVVEFLRLSETWGGAQMDIATTYEQALDAMQRTAYDVAFFDYMLGARDGLALLRDVRGKGVETPVVVLTSRGAEDVAVEAMKAGAADYLSKVHLSIEALERTIHHALALGTGVVSPLELTDAYTMFPGGGEVVRPRGITDVFDANGNEVLEHPVDRVRVISPEAAFQMVSLLRDVVDRGTAATARAWGVRGPVGASRSRNRSA
ncbi:MAG: hypothetical protein DMG00_20750 [Acidobacteria bacterium]|nr:MAG: hypothetical protein DMG00_20750 [Acidobacteriota bacterium]